MDSRPWTAYNTVYAALQFCGYIWKENCNAAYTNVVRKFFYESLDYNIINDNSDPELRTSDAWDRNCKIRIWRLDNNWLLQ